MCVLGLHQADHRYELPNMPYACRAPLVPAFAFGQSDLYHYYRPGPPLIPQSFMAFISRKIGFVPIMFCGNWGTTVPLKVPMTVVFGDPIATEKISEPTDDQCRRYNDLFIAELECIFYKHREDAGHPDLELHIM
jgi:diacylglycerol O-acyltransferase 2, plant